METLKLDCPRQIGKTTFCKHLLELNRGQIIMMVVPTICFRELISKDKPKLKSKIIVLGEIPRGKRCDVLIFDDCMYDKLKYKEAKKILSKLLLPELIIEIYTSHKIEGILNKLYR